LRQFFIFVLAALLPAFSLPAFGQIAPPPSRPIPLRVETTLVVIPVSVTDASNRFVLGLEKQNFSLLEDGVVQKVKQFAGEDAPLSIGLLVDVSGSMGTKLETSRQTMDTHDEAFLIEFSDRAKLVAGFTDQAQEIDEKLTSAEPEGLTALLDAVSLGIDEMKKSKNPRKALLIVSDGGDNNSQYTSSQIEDLVRQADVQIYAMGVFEQFPFAALTSAELSGPRLLQEIAQQTGGRAFPARSFSALPAIARQIGIDLRNQYVLAYSPSNEEKNGKYRKVQVKLNPPAGLSELKARWRLGYYAPAQ
jgi:VWFA-related protein